MQLKIKLQKLFIIFGNNEIRIVALHELKHQYMFILNYGASIL